MISELQLDISEIFRGMKPGRLQSVGIMQVLPLIGDPELFDDDIIPPNDPENQTMFSTHNYGEMTFQNPTDKVLLVPSHAGYVTRESAQDHAMSRAGLVGKTTKKFTDAMCIQETQGGHISSAQHKMLILPYSLRESALKKRKSREYSKLWDDIRKFNRSLGIEGRAGHLEYFLTHFKKQLDEFVAEFECIPKQAGAIILIDGHVVGLERAPSDKFWKCLWSALIRECYGSLAIKVSNKRSANPTNRVPLRGKFASLDELEAGLNQARKEEDEAAKKIIRSLLDKPFKCKAEDNLRSYEILTVENEQFTGQVVKKGDAVCYSSLFTKESWAKNAPWREASKFVV